MELKLKEARLYRVKKGQTVECIARAFEIPPRALAARNGLSGEAEEGRVLEIPARGNVYTVRGGESRSRLCGSNGRFRELNGTDCLYPTQEVLI